MWHFEQELVLILEGWEMAFDMISKVVFKFQ